MKYINDLSSLVIKSWCDNPEEGAIEQAKHLARLPFAFKQICLMPDTHLGYGMPIGGVLATRKVIIPNAVGSDIGCGMIAAKTNLVEIDTTTLKSIMSAVRKTVPVGFNRHKDKQDIGFMPSLLGRAEYLEIVENQLHNAVYQIGTLGGGNHFIEIQRGNDGYIWIMVHSGSRNLGKQVADYYNKLAVDLNAKYFSTVPKEWELAFLPIDSDSGQAYLSEMQYCVDFALANRKLMLNRISDIFTLQTPGIVFEEPINIAHNYATLENHFGQNVLVHRKGATSAKIGELGIIPGSQGTSSYIVKGKGNPESFESCSHGAGRRMGRNEARRTLSLADEQNRLDSKGIIHAIRGVQDLDEASGAYKDIDIVMQEQSDLVDIVVKLEPLAVIKG